MATEPFILSLTTLYGVKVVQAYRLTLQASPLVQERFCNHTEDVTFQGEVYEAVGMRVPELSGGSIGQPPIVNITVSNVDRRLIDWLEQYWFTVVSPLWTVESWLINPESPDDTPITQVMEYEVESVNGVTSLSATIKLRPRHMPQSRPSPREVYTRQKVPIL